MSKFEQWTVKRLTVAIGEKSAKRLYDAVVTMIFAGVYYTCALSSLELALGKTNASPLWLPSGIAFTTLFFLGTRFWSGIWLGAFFANAVMFLSNNVADPYIASAAIATGNTFEAIVGVTLLNWLVSSRNPLLRTQDIFLFLFATLVAALVSATIGSGTVGILQQLSWPMIKMVWFTWWMGDVLSILLITPLFLVIFNASFKLWPLKRIVEAVAVISIIMATNVCIFGDIVFISKANFPTVYLVLPLIVWATYRFGFWGTVVPALITLAMGLKGTLHGYGPFVGADLNSSLLVLQIFVGILTLTGLVLAAALYEHTKAVEALRINSLRFQALVENSEDMILLLDATGIITYASPAVSKVFGYALEDYLGHHILEHIHPHDCGFLSQRLKESLTKPGEIIRGQCRAHHKDGTWRWVEGTGYNLLDDPSMQAIVINYRDITVRKRSEAMERYLSFLIENSSEAIISKSLDGVINSWNRGAEQLYGYSAREVIGKPIDILLPPHKKEEFAQILVKIREGLTVEQLETQRRKKSGEIVDVLLSVSPIKDDSGALIGISAITYDITERKLAEQTMQKDKEWLESLVDERSKELLSTQKELKQVSRLADIGTLAATVAHELRNPLGVIQMAAYNLRRKKEELAQDKHLLNIEKKIWEGNRIIDNLLSYSRIKIPMLEKVDMMLLLNDSISTTQSRFQEQNVRIEKSFVNNGAPCFIEADSVQIKEIFINILNNAVQSYGNEPGVVTVKVVQHDDMVDVIIEDKGGGIEENDLNKVFTPFFTRKSKGTGLGLTICNELVALHQGKITIESKLKQGTTVCISLPVMRNIYEPTRAHH